jgi:hypothetical protein
MDGEVQGGYDIGPPAPPPGKIKKKLVNKNAIKTIKVKS